MDVAVKASVKRSLSFARLPKNRWRTASAVDLVVAAVPHAINRADVEVIAFNATQLIAKFDEAWKALKNAGRPVSFGMPVFVPLDEVAPKNVGHSVTNLKAIAIWSVCLNAEEVELRTSEEPFLDRVKREFAKFNGVDVSKVEIEFRIKL